MTFPSSNFFSASQPDRVNPGSHERSLPEDWSLVFTLIDRVLPFEACLYHQILPLSLQGNRLFLGMVTLEDTAALEYARRILQFLNYRLVPQTITSETHHTALSAYLSHTRASDSSAPKSAPAPRQPSTLSHSPTAVPTVSISTASAPTASAPTASAPQPFQDATIPNLTAAAMSEIPIDAPTSSPAPAPAVTQEPSQETSTAELENSLNNRETLVLQIPEDFESVGVETVAVEIVATTPSKTSHHPVHALVDEDGPPTIPFQNLRAPAVPLSSLPTLDIQPQHLHSSPDVLKNLTPQQLLVELLGRSLMSGIGRLFFTRNAETGQVLWSESGVLQSIVADLPIALFEALLLELKQLLRLPPTPLSQPQQVEIERIYQRERLLLRLRVVPKPNGEEATLQVLRGSALKFYQQQQLASISRDTLNVAQELQRKVSELHDRARSQDQENVNASGEVPELDQMISYVEMQLTRLKQLKKSQQQKSQQKSQDR
jgi:type II secretory ATPase GspE/PulE/Tfp pilus assembly ATPase PilB-like protein